MSDDVPLQLPRYVFRRANGSFRYKRNVPERLRPLIGKATLYRQLGDSYREAMQALPLVHARIEALLNDEANKSARERSLEIIRGALGDEVAEMVLAETVPEYSPIEDALNERGNDRGRRRRDGYIAALADAKLPPIIWPSEEQGSPSGIELGAAVFEGCLKVNPATNALMCVSDQVAVGVICEAKRRGVEVPGSLSVSGFGGFELAMSSGFDLTTIEIPGREIGVASAKALLNPEAARAKKVIDVGYTLVERGTT